MEELVDKLQRAKEGENLRMLPRGVTIEAETEKAVLVAFAGGPGYNKNVPEIWFPKSVLRQVHHYPAGHHREEPNKLVGVAAWFCGKENLWNLVQDPSPQCMFRKLPKLYDQAKREDKLRETLEFEPKVISTFIPDERGIHRTAAVKGVDGEIATLKLEDEEGEWEIKGIVRQ